MPNPANREAGDSELSRRSGYQPQFSQEEAAKALGWSRDKAGMWQGQTTGSTVATDTANQHIPMTPYPSVHIPEP